MREVGGSITRPGNDCIDDHKQLQAFHGDVFVGFMNESKDALNPTAGSVRIPTWNAQVLWPRNVGTRRDGELETVLSTS